MEYALRDKDKDAMEVTLKVLILVLMEYALREEERWAMSIMQCLNPCFNGICSARALLGGIPRRL